LDKNAHIEFWLKSAKYDLEVVESLFLQKKFDYCLFVGHLVIEKTLKATWIKDNETNVPPKIHNLIKLISECNLQFSDNIIEDLRIINEFNIEARYPDYKFSFYNRCTAEYTENWIKKIKELYQWLLNQL